MRSLASRFVSPLVHRAPADGNLKRQYGGLDTFLVEGKLLNSHGALVIYTDGAAPSNGKRRNGQVIARSGCGVFGGPWLSESFANPSSLVSVFC